MVTPAAPRGVPEGTPPSLRQRFRVQARQAILDAARQQIAAAGGAGGLSLNAVARDVGMAGPSLYRYFPSRDALLTELIVEGYVDLAGTLHEGLAAYRRRAAAVREPAAELTAYANLYRDWALAHPAVYELLMGAPVPSYTAPPEATNEPARRSMTPVVQLVAQLLAQRSKSAPDTMVRPAPGWATILQETGVPEQAFVTALGFWSTLHGLLELELHGHLGQMVADPAALYASEVERFLRQAAR